MKAPGQFIGFIALLLFTGMCFSSAQAQFYPVWNAYYDHGLSWNPAFAGSHEAVSLSAWYRRQWMGLPDGPSTAAVAIHAPLWNRGVGLGAELFSEQLGPLQRHAVQGHFAWRRPTRRGTFALGVNGGARLEQGDLSALDAAADGDPAFAGIDNTRWDWNAGSGLLYYNRTWMAGLSAMDLAADRQYFAQASALIRFGSGSGVQPLGLLRYPENGPWLADAGLRFLFVESVWAGGTYRTNGDLIFDLKYVLHSETALGFSEWAIGYSYQIASPDFRTDWGGSHEVQLAYRFQKDKTRELGPRFF